VGDVNGAIISRIQSGESDAYHDICEANGGLVAHVAQRYAPLADRRGDIDLDDLMQSGLIGLIRAAHAYDPERGAKFSTFAVFYIRNEMRRALGIQTGKRDPCANAAPLHTPANADDPGGATLGDTIAADEGPDRLEAEELREAVRAAVARMKGGVDRDTIEARYWQGMTVEQIADGSGITAGAVHERLRKGYGTLRKDRALRMWAVDYGAMNLHRRKGARAFNVTFTSVVEDAVFKAEELAEAKAALSNILGELL
jgi:RNA polymerase sigma factor (sigma-70 family)